MKGLGWLLAFFIAIIAVGAFMLGSSAGDAQIGGPGYNPPTLGDIHCPSGGVKTGADGSELNAVVLVEGTSFCVKAGPGNTGKLVADGAKTLCDYLIEAEIEGGNTCKDVSYYTVYSTSIPTPSPTPTPCQEKLCETPAPTPAPTPISTATPIPSATPTRTSSVTPTPTAAPEMTPTFTSTPPTTPPILELPSALPSTGGEGSDGGVINWLNGLLGIGIGLLIGGSAVMLFNYLRYKK